MLVTTWNVNGVRAREAQLLAWLERDRPDVICLQETKATREQLSPALLSLSGYHGYWHAAPKGYSGVALHLRADALEGVAPVFAHPSHDMESRLVTAELPARAGAPALVFASLYMPNGGKDYPAKVAFMRAMATWVREVHASGRQLILCGDMNVARADMDVHAKLRDSKVIGQTPEERALFADMLGDDLVDVQREREPDNGELFTWWPYWRQHRERNIGWRLDYALVSRPLLARVRACRILKDVGTSDHAPLALELD